MSLRAFAFQHGYDPGNLSKLERGRLAPPDSPDQVSKYATELQLRRGSEEWITFHDAWAAERGRIPVDILGDEELIQKLPVVFRSLRGLRGATDEELRELAEKIRRA